jgi:hypothetical protein
VSGASTRFWPSNRDRRALSVGFAIVATLVVAGRGYPAWTAWAGARRTTAAAAVQRAALAAQAARSLGAMRDSAVARDARLNRLQPALFAAPSLTEAGATVARAVSDVADENSVQLLALSIRPDSARHARVAPVAVRLTLDADLEGLVGLLRDLEGADVLFAIRELLIERVEAEPERLRAELLIEALAFVDRPRVETPTKGHRIRWRR